jgi:hypothetical protein
MPYMPSLFPLYTFNSLPSDMKRGSRRRKFGVYKVGHHLWGKFSQHISQDFTMLLPAEEVLAISLSNAEDIAAPQVALIVSELMADCNRSVVSELGAKQCGHFRLQVKLATTCNTECVAALSCTRAT